jgi:hypothetical protein
MRDLHGRLLAAEARREDARLVSQDGYDPRLVVRGDGSHPVAEATTDLGRVLREMGQLGPTGPTEVAATIAKGAGLKGTPVAAKIGRDILVGVIPYDINVRIGP